MRDGLFQILDGMFHIYAVRPPGAPQKKACVQRARKPFLSVLQLSCLQFLAGTVVRSTVAFSAFW